MRLKTRWLLVSVVGGVLIAVVFVFVSAETPIGVGVGVPGPLEAVAKELLWPIAVCLYLSGPGPNIGSPEKHLHEWTPVQDFAVITGIALSWVFYSSVVFLLIWLQQRRHALRGTSGTS